MFKDYAIEYFKVMQNMYSQQKDKVDFNFKGENATLGFINKNPNASPKNISEFFNISSARVASILNSLEAKDLIKRYVNPADKRQFIITTTPKGAKLSRSIYLKHIELATSIFKQLGEQDTKKGLEILLKIQDILNKLFMEGDEIVTT